MAMELDEVLEIMNGLIDTVEDKLGKAEDRTETVGHWLILLDRAIELVKSEWHHNYGVSDDCEENALIGMMNLAAVGILCLEQFAGIYAESCPWEHSFSYDDPLSTVDTIIAMERQIALSKGCLWDNPNNPYRSALTYVKEMVILGVSCLLRNVTVE